MLAKSTAPRLLVWAALAAVLAAIAWFVLRPVPKEAASTSASVAPSDSRASASEARSVVPRMHDGGASSGRGTSRASREDRARRDALREQIRERRREAIRRGTSSTRPRDATPDDPPQEGTGGEGFVNRMGEQHAALAQAINRELSALADECVTAAGERASDLSGTLAMDVRAIADPELGAVIDTVDVTAEGEGIDDELRDCVRESAMSMLLPAPEAGEVAFMVSMRLP